MLKLHKAIKKGEKLALVILAAQNLVNNWLQSLAQIEVEVLN